MEQEKYVSLFLSAGCYKQGPKGARLVKKKSRSISKAVTGTRPKVQLSPICLPEKLKLGGETTGFKLPGN